MSFLEFCKANQKNIRTKNYVCSDMRAIDTSKIIKINEKYLNTKLFAEKKRGNNMGERQRISTNNLDELFGASGSNKKYEMIDSDLILSFHSHEKGNPYAVDTETDNFRELLESVKENGVMVPIIVRENDGYYEIISGHRRKKRQTYVTIKKFLYLSRTVLMKKL